MHLAWLVMTLIPILDAFRYHSVIRNEIVTKYYLESLIPHVVVSVQFQLKNAVGSYSLFYPSEMKQHMTAWNCRFFERNSTRVIYAIEPFEQRIVID